MNKHNKAETFTDTGANRWLPEGSRVWEGEKQVREIKRYKLSVTE